MNLCMCDDNSSKNVTIRLEEGNPLPGLIYILKCT